jgi:hypothetical protein
LRVPGLIGHNEPTAFLVVVPKRFEAPIIVEYQPNGLSVTRTGELTGTVVGFNNDTIGKSASLRAVVTDAKGRRASTSFGIDIRPAPKPVAVYTPPSPKPSYRPPVASNSAPAPAPKKPDMSDVKNFNDQMAAIRQQRQQRQAEIDAKYNQRQREIAQATRKFGQPGYSPYQSAPAPASSANRPSESTGAIKKFGPHVRPLPCALKLVLVKIEGGKVIDDRGYHMYAETQNGCRAARGSFSLKQFARHAGNVCGVPVLHITSKNDRRGWRSTIETAQERGFYPNAYAVVNGDPNTTNRPLPENLGVCPW